MRAGQTNKDISACNKNTTQSSPNKLPSERHDQSCGITACADVAVAIETSDSPLDEDQETDASRRSPRLWGPEWIRKRFKSYEKCRTSSKDQDKKSSGSSLSQLHKFLVVFVVVILIATTALLCWHFLRKKTDKKPHVLLLIADDLGWADVGWHSSDILTPTLTKLARNGTILNHFYSQPICTASRAALLSGRYPFKLGLQGSRPILAGAPGSLPLTSKLLPELMKDAGYRTHMIGKWHLGFETIRHTPVMRGFDTFFGFYNGMQDYYTHTTSGFDVVDGLGGYDMRRDYMDSDGNPHINNILWGDKGKYNTFLFTEEAINVVEDHVTNFAESPLFLVMSYPNPHSPIQVPDEFVNSSQNEHILNDFRKTYAGLVSSMDTSVANITAALSENGMFDDTLVIFISDNGGSLTSVKKGTAFPTGASNYPLRGDKGTLWEAGSRVPAFIAGRNVPKGRTVSACVHITDIFPSLISYLNLDSMEQLDGNDQSRLLMMETDETALDYFIYDIDPVYKQAAIRYGNWKLIVGDPATNEVNGRYHPLTKAGESSYPDAGLPFGEYVAKAYRMIGEYKAAVQTTPMCRTISCFYPTGLQDKVKLFDLSVDEYEFNDLSSQHPDIVSKLIKILDREMAEMIAPVNLLDEGVEAASPKFFNGTWMPWLPDPGSDSSG